MNIESREKTVIEAGQGSHRYWQDLWAFRELFFFLTWRDILVRYKQTVFGILWSVLRPLLTMLVFTFVFGKVANLPADGGVAYPVMVFAALMPWQMFANALQESSNSLIGNEALISKVYFPRMILPISSIITSAVDFLISFALFLVMMLIYGVSFHWQILLLPLFVGMALLTAIGTGLIISALNVSFRDFRYIIPFLVQFGLYVSPVGFSSAVIPEQWRLLYSLNPMVGVIDGFRWCLLGEHVVFYWPGFLASIAVMVLCLVVGVRVFRTMERGFADKI
ncbi:MAG: ABC transporter permease [Alphaproteobacteria bacterium]|nr:ABC transporter permease [Alphaproteobacteria bacterium]